MSKILGRHWRSRGSSWTKFVRTPTCWSLVLTKFFEIWMAKRTELGMSLCSSKTRIILIGIRGWYQNGWKEAENGSHVEDIGDKRWYRRILESQHLSWIMYIWDALNVKANQTRKLILRSTEKMFESRISAGATGNYWREENLTQRRVRGRWKDMLKKCVERYCELANKKTEQLYKVSTPCLYGHHYKREDFQSVGDLS